MSTDSEPSPLVLLRPTCTELQVRFSDTDQLGHINNQAYAGYAEIGRSDFFARIEEENKPWFVLSRLEMLFHHEAFFGDRLCIITRISQLGRASLTVTQRVVRDEEEVVCSITAVMVCIDTESRRPRRIPAHWRLAEQEGPLLCREIIDRNYGE